jgi:hypothetical protein
MVAADASCNMRTAFIGVLNGLLRLKITRCPPQSVHCYLPVRCSEEPRRESVTMCIKLVVTNLFSTHCKIDSLQLQLI